jgi:NPCBM-associated, NEW3 domain of alpha-galactosidase
MTSRRTLQVLTAATGTIVATAALAVSAQSAPRHLGLRSDHGRGAPHQRGRAHQPGKPSSQPYVEPNLQQLPALPVNACNNSALPKDYGTNFATPSDPLGFGFANETTIGWEGNIYAPFEYLSGSYFARGVPQTYTAGRSSYCGAMYSFGAYTWGLAAGQAPAAGSVQWNMADGYLPAMTTSFTRNDVKISITDFADKQTIAGNPVELVYTRVSVTNQSSAAVDVPSDASGPNLVTLNDESDTVQPGQTVHHDFVAAVDTFTLGGTLPTVAQLTPAAGNPGATSYDRAFGHMKAFWTGQVSQAPTLSLPNVSLPNTGGLADPGTAMDNAYKAAFVYTRIVQVEQSPFSAANNYDWLLNHDVPGILDNRFEMGDFTDAQNLLLSGRISEASNFNEQGANWYWDGVWRTPIAWAQYLEGTNNVAFVKTYFHDDATAPSQWGPSLYTMMHTDLLAQISSTTGYLKRSNDNDSEGTWVFDDETALAGLQAYAYIADRIGDTAEATWAQNEYTSLLNATNAGLAANEAASGTDFLPCEVNVPITADRCGSANDANWASQLLWGENQWTIFLQGGQLNGILGDPSQSDNMYQLGFARLQGTGVPFPSFGAYTGYSVALNTAYSADALFGNAYRDLPITSYAWQIASTTGGPNSWWEANGSAPDPTNPWQGSHAAPQFGADPYVWPMAGQTQTVLQSLVAQGMTSKVNSAGVPSYSPVVYIGRGVPDAWIKPGQTISVGHLTSSYNETSGRRETYGVRISTDRELGSTAVHVTVSGQVPGSNLQVQLPVFADAGVRLVSGGHYNDTTQTVTMNGRSATILLGNAGKPTVNVSVASTVPGTHTQPALDAGEATTATATFTNTGGSVLTHVTLTASVPSGWTVQATSPTSFTSIAPGATKTVTYSLTPPAGANGSNGVVVSASYSTGFGPAQAASAEQWVSVQKPLPLPAGASDLALTATASASYSSPWTTITAINNGVYPIQSSDDSDLTPYWGTWPNGGTQWMELDWTQPITTNATSVYFADDGGGVQLPSSWVVQYWDGTTWQNVTNPSSYPAADNVFNNVTFDPVTTTKLRVSMVTAPTASGVGAIQWIVPSIPSGS